MADLATDSTVTAPDWLGADTTSMPLGKPPAGGDTIDSYLKPSMSPAQEAQAQTDLRKATESHIGTLAANERLREEDDRRYREHQEAMFNAEGATMRDLEHNRWDADKEAAKYSHNLWEQFGSPGFIIAMIGSAFTTMPMNSALNAGAAAMNSINQGDYDAYQRHFQAWKENTDLTLKRLDLEEKQFAQLDNLRKSNLAEWAAKTEAEMAKFNDTRKLALMRAGMYEELDQARASQAEGKAKLAKAQKEIMDNNNQITVFNQYLKAHPGDIMGATRFMNAVFSEPRTAEEIATRDVILAPDFADLNYKDQNARVNEAVKGVAAARASGRPMSLSQLQTTTIMQRAEEIRAADPEHISPSEALLRAQNEVPTISPGAPQVTEEGDTKPPPGWSQKQWDFAAKLYRQTGHLPSIGLGASGVKQGLMAHAGFMEEKEGGTAGGMAARWATNKALGTTLTKLEQQRAAVESFSKTALANGKVLYELAKKVDKTGLPVWERWQRAGKKAIAGDEDVTKFDAQLQAYRNEVSRIITSPNLTGALTVHAMQEGKQFAEEGYTAKQVKAITDLFEGDFERRRKPLEEEIASIQKQIAGTDDVPKMPSGGAVDTSGFRIVK